MSDGRSTSGSDERAALRERIALAASERQEETVRLLQDLVRVRSVNPWFLEPGSPSEESAVQDIFAERLDRLGARLDRWEPDSDALAHHAGGPGYYPGRDFSGRPNLVGTVPGSGGGRSLILLGHADVVSEGKGWTRKPFGAERDGGKVYGRGTSDMKGGLAAAIGALEVLADLGVRRRGDVIFASVVDEEAGGMGTLAFVDRGYQANGAIIPEPSDLKVAPLCRGILWGRITIPGRSSHIEMPQPHWREGGAVDAIALGRSLLDAIDRLNDRWAADPAKNHTLLPLPCQVKVAMLEAGEYPTAYANSMTITFNVQYLPSERDERGLGGRVKAELEEFFVQFASTHPWLHEHPPEVEWMVDADCGETPADSPLVELTRRSAETAGSSGIVEGISSHTDMGLLVNAGIPSLNFGPGSPSLAHQSDEYVSEQSLLAATATLALIISEWCG
jgi:acetylornithine deacetylase